MILRLTRFCLPLILCASAVICRVYGEDAAEVVPLPPVEPPPADKPEPSARPDNHKNSKTADNKKKTKDKKEKAPEIGEPPSPAPQPTPEPVKPPVPPAPEAPHTPATPPVTPADSTPPTPIKKPDPAPADAATPADTSPKADLVPLPARNPDLPPVPDKPEKKPLAGNPVKKPDVRIINDHDSVTLMMDKTELDPGSPAQINLYGPETLLRSAGAHLLLSDGLGREIARAEIKVQDLPFSEGKPRQINLNLNHQLPGQYTFQFKVDCADGSQIARALRFSIKAEIAEQRWDHWLSFVSSSPSPADWQALHDLGIRGGMQYRLSPARREALRKGNALFYVENVSRQLMSNYHTEQGLWEKTLAAMAKDRNNHKVLQRNPCFSAQTFAEGLARELKRHGETYRADSPLFYSLSSEPSTTRLAAAVDFDFSPATLTEFQRWLEHDIYGNISTLNASWDTQFKSWSEVVPMTTDEARMRLKDGVLNFGPWVDFRDFQDYTFAKVLHEGGDYLRQFDPAAKAGITGAMGPFAFGGWDWSRLAQSLDAVECYDIGGARSLWRDLAPGKPALTTVTLPRSDSVDPAHTAEMLRSIWSFALEGGRRGVLLWDERNGGGESPSVSALLSRDGKPSEIALQIAPALKALDGETGLLLGNSKRLNDGVAVLYSPASVRMHWLLEADALHGDKWLESWGADTTAERRESPQLRLRESWSKLLDDMGLEWHFVSSAQLVKRETLTPGSGIKTLVLPQTVALSDAEVAALKQFAANGGRIVADCACGRFDEHGKLRDKPALDEIFGIDSSTEPFLPEPMNPLENVAAVATLPRPEGAEAVAAVESHPSPAKVLTPENLKELAPVFSDKPKWVTAARTGAEYRHSPVLTSNAAAAYLNLDLSEYLLWRLHPDSPRGRITRDLIASIAFHDRLSECLIDWSNTQLPQGTQLTWLQPENGAGTAKILALRRNPQARLHELGRGGDDNSAFNTAEHFKIAFKSPQYISPLSSGLPMAETNSKEGLAKLEGTLDPVTPSIFMLSPVKAVLTATLSAAQLKAGGVLEVKITPRPDDISAHTYAIHVIGPDTIERAHYGGIRNGSGNLSHFIPFALNDATGDWTIVLRDLAVGGETLLKVNVGN